MRILNRFCALPDDMEGHALAEVSLRHDALSATTATAATTASAATTPASAATPTGVIPTLTATTAASTAASHFGINLFRPGGFGAYFFFLFVGPLGGLLVRPEVRAKSPGLGIARDSCYCRKPKNFATPEARVSS
jgi:hypothetical protein